ncbi:MAG: MurR/RpiR family transcriptional regulator [Beijerinckiaceae bacterium]|jgi:DNA-binding MurR/RpiR family transcriptional regulator|nr:MurR/RpiR family transcriptional regulator [Beijerinckiaceae bacterium]
MISTLRQRLQACLLNGSKADKVIASYMLADLAGIPFETAATLAAKVSVSEPTVGRFCRALGYQSFRDLKQQLRQDLGDKPWLISDRLLDFQQRSLNSGDQLARSLELEIAGLVALYEQAQSDSWRRAVMRLATVPSIFVAGFQTERGMAQYLVNQLHYLRDGVQLTDAAGGNFSDVLLADPATSSLVIFEARRYSRLAKVLAQEAKTAGVHTILVSDAFCEWGRGLVDEMLVVSTQFNLFWDSSAQMASLVSLLVNAIFIELGPQVEVRMNTIAALHGRITGNVGDKSGPIG